MAVTFLSTASVAGFYGSSKQFHQEPRSSASAAREELGNYLGQIRQLPLLTHEQEQHYACCAQRGQQLAREQMICHNLRLVIRIAQRYRRAGVSFADLVSEGVLGLIRAVDKFDPELGYRFSTYACWWIQDAVERALDGQLSVVRRPRSLLLQRRRQQRLASAAEEGQRVELQDECHRLLPDSLTDSSLPEQLTTEDAIHGDSPCRQYEKEQLAVRLLEWVMDMPAAQAQVVLHYYGLAGYAPHTLLELAKELQLSRQQVITLRDRALQSLQRRLLENGLEQESLFAD